MDGLNYCVRHSHGKFNFLDKAYNKFIKESLSKGDDNDIERWEVYNTIMVELINLGRVDYFDEAKYRITGNEKPNDVMLDIINRDYEIKSILSEYIERLNYFIDCDLISRFYKRK